MKIRMFFIVISMCVILPVTAQVKLPQIIRDSMILQRDARIRIWGWASAGEEVTIQFNGKTYHTKTGKDGKWLTTLSPLKAGGPYTMHIKGKNKITLHNILIGDVWLCAGQSNMVHQMKLHNLLYANEIANANYSAIRQFWIPNTANLQAPQNDLPGGYWKCANPTDINEFSAVAYFFAKKLYDKYHIPIGIINASWGGTPIEAWTSEEGLQPFPEIVTTLEKNKDTAYINNLKRLSQATILPPSEDKGITQKWFSATYTPQNWRRIAIPGYWEDQGIRNLNGTVWYRREITTPESMTSRPAKIFMGRIVDADELYINGQKIGTTGYMYPQRRYNIPAGVLKAGKNMIVIRVTNYNGKGGFVPDKPYQLISEKDTIDLTGYWTYKVGQVFSPDNKRATNGITAQNQPASLYNAMIAPIIHYPLKGFVWYQGESNTANPDEYAKLQPAMIADWRTKWKQGDIPFLFAQLPGFMDYQYLPAESQWASFREAQAKSLNVTNTAIAVTIDLGEWNDIHPDRKKEVGDRLALAAEKLAYGENIVYSGPCYESAVVDGNRIIITFKHTGNGLATTDGEAPQEFAIAGADKKFVWANTKIEGNSIIVWKDSITAPRYIRYAWADNPVNPNLINKEGLPAIPFRTDN